MSSSRSQHHSGCNHRQGRRRRPASSLQSRYESDYNTYELLSTSSFNSRYRSYSKSDHSKHPSETHAESSSSATVKSESPATDSSHVSKVALKPPQSRFFCSSKDLQYTFDWKSHKEKDRLGRIRASDARAQVQNAPAPGAGPRYPSVYHNATSEGTTPLNFQAPRPRQHIPLFRGRQQPPHPLYDCKPGPYRAVYNDNDRTTFDVMYHDVRQPVSRDGNHQFSLGRYHPRSEHRDPLPVVHENLVEAYPEDMSYYEGQVYTGPRTY